MITEIKINGKVYGIKFGNFANNECESRFGFNPLTAGESGTVIDVLKMHQIIFCGILNFYRKELEKAISYDEFYDAYDDAIIPLAEVVKLITDGFMKSQVVSNYIEFAKTIESENSKKKKK